MMIIDGIEAKADEVIISPSRCKINGEYVETNNIEVISKDGECHFCFWTLIPFEEFNNLKLNEKVSIMDKIDSYDLSLTIKDSFYIASEENSELYFTKIDKDTFRLNVLITDFDDNVVSSDGNLEKFVIDTIVMKK